jgi:hypothetical protein
MTEQGAQVDVVLALGGRGGRWSSFGPGFNPAFGFEEAGFGAEEFVVVQAHAAFFAASFIDGVGDAFGVPGSGWHSQFVSFVPNRISYRF